MSELKKAYINYTEAERKAFETAGGCIKNPLIILLVVGGIGLAGMMGGIAVEGSKGSTTSTPDYNSGVLVVTPNSPSTEGNNEPKLSPGSIFSTLPGNSESNGNTQQEQNTQPSDRVEVQIDNCQGFPAEVVCRYDSCEIKRSIPLDQMNIFQWHTHDVPNIQAAQEYCAETTQ